ncbi:AraC family transcriptional regulator [Enterococcus faecalis]
MSKETVITGIMDSLYKKYLIPMMLFDDQNTVVYPTITWNTQEIVKNFIQPAKQSTVVLFNDFSFMYSVIYFEWEARHYALLIGPCGVVGTNQEKISIDNHDYFYNIHYTKETSEDFEKFVQLLYSIFTHQQLSKEALFWCYQNREGNELRNTEQRLESNLYNRRMQETTFDSYQFELRYAEYIKRKQPEKIEWLFKKMRETYQVELSKNVLEGLKLKFSAFVAILTRISIDEGIPINQAFSLSDALIQGLYRIHSSEEWHVYMKEATYRFMNLIHEQPISGKSLLVKQLVNYIDGHIYERITLDELVLNFDKHKTHLTSVFKKEMNQTIHNYILDRKINESKHLLLFTDKSHKEISIQLAFSSQSHFIKTFKKRTGLTPREYRNQHYAYTVH